MNREPNGYGSTWWTVIAILCTAAAYAITFMDEVPL